ncbi:hypothetical protein QE451_002496 [Paenibacillus sp. SORGH_AS338]|uniref:NIPSNAP family protein n=1 Tax=Paenibacillus sp. SORGH_AS_0338 TaxID=3041755 RepID=UPI0028546815|nr:NIPSNAP family protein [Paenibacillus sp. SORGH_AS_0338]MDR6110835.1 hypothetical protein [Paenibacillus sp. SORGH_AS_0338]
MGIFFHMKVRITSPMLCFSFPSLADYEEYRQKMMVDEECQQAFEFANHNKCIISYERSFMRPVFE